MIALTRLNGNPIYINSDLIKYAEAAPDTMLTLIHGEKMVVRESCEEVVQRMTAQRIYVLRSVSQPDHGSDAIDAEHAETACSIHTTLKHLTGERSEASASEQAAAHRRRPKQF